MSRANKTRFHLPDGPAQAARDAEWARAGDRSPEALRWLYGFDATVLPS
jgi:salicylate hydroxylase